jgi:mRNA interferase YafQ
MWTPAYTKKFKKSILRCTKRGYDIDLFKQIAILLIKGLPLPNHYKPHKLGGEFVNHWECHIKSDWLLIYRYDEMNKKIIFEDTGTHSDLF